VPYARRLRLPRSSVYKRWMNGRPPTLGGEAAVVHAPSLAFPPPDGRPLIVTVHDTLFLEDPDTFPPPALAFNRAMVERLSDADTVIVPSRTTGNTLATLGKPPKRIRVVPLGTDMAPPPYEERTAMLERLGVEQPYVLWTGTLEARRNPEGVVRGFVRALEADVPDADKLSLYLAGPPGWWSKDLASFVDSKGLTPRVRRIDQQPGPVRAALYAGASAFVFPSLAEGFGLPIIEAMSCGAPVVTSNRSSLPEIAGSAAELCDPVDYESIGDALGKVLRDSGLAEDLRRLGFRRAAEFTWERTARETLACYREALAARDIPEY
jgi:glycosyltransferase involved in cell wall biosynthesis